MRDTGVRDDNLKEGGLCKTPSSVSVVVGVVLLGTAPIRVAAPKIAGVMSVDVGPKAIRLNTRRGGIEPLAALLPPAIHVGISSPKFDAPQCYPP